MSKPENDIDELITRSLAGETSSEEEQMLQGWRARATENEKHYQQLRKSFLLANQYYRPTQIPDVDLDTEWNRFLGAVEKKTDDKVRTLNPVVWLRVAAGVLLVAVSGILYNYFTNTGTTVIETGASAQVITLPDGSTVTLNQNSKLTYRTSFNGSDRHVTLVGEAFFEVAHNAAKPFTISVGDATVEVLGTSFNVRGNGHDRLEVVVATGTVKLRAPAKTAPVTLQAGDRGVYDPHLQTLENDVNTDVNFNAWKTRKLSFTEANLRDVVETLNRVYHVNMVIAVPVPDTCLVTVSFDQQELSAVLNVLKVTLNLDYTMLNNKIEITRVGC